MVVVNPLQNHIAFSILIEGDGEKRCGTFLNSSTMQSIQERSPRLYDGIPNRTRAYQNQGREDVAERVNCSLVIIVALSVKMQTSCLDRFGRGNEDVRMHVVVTDVEEKMMEGRWPMEGAALRIRT
jgi:hypothetical protein